jgi:enterochelin esterase family protein
MIRFAISSVIALSLAAFARAQDMPLAQILIDGEGWKKGEGSPPSGRAFQLPQATPPQKEGAVQLTLDGRSLMQEAGHYLVRGGPTAGVLSRDSGTAFLGYRSGDVWAFPVLANGELKYGEPYCPIRVDTARWKGNPDAKPMPVTSMTGDKDGRIYAATALGVQIFDPTGRLCGVLTPAAPGKAEHLAFEGDKLVLWIGEQKYERKLRTSGVKR